MIGGLAGGRDVDWNHPRSKEVVVSIDRAAADARSPFWVVPTLRAALALVPALVITFSPDHTPAFGLLVFGSWALVSGAVIDALQLRLSTDRGEQVLFSISAVISAVAGLLALATTDGGLPFFLFLVSAWAAVTGILELLAGIGRRARVARSGAPSPIARDWIVVGVLTAVLAVAYLLPLGSVVAVGLLGAYLVVVGVYLGIAGLSLRWDRPAATVTPNEEAA